MEHPPDESSLQRAKRDTISYFSTVRFWIFDMLITAGLTIWVLLWTPHFSRDWHKIAYQVMIPILGAIAGLAIIFLISLFLAPYKQRDEARKDIAKRTYPSAICKQPIRLIPKRKVKRIVQRTKVINGKPEYTEEIEIEP